MRRLQVFMMAGGTTTQPSLVMIGRFTATHHPAMRRYSGSRAAGDRERGSVDPHGRREDGKRMLLVWEVSHRASKTSHPLTDTPGPLEIDDSRHSQVYSNAVADTATNPTRPPLDITLADHKRRLG
jgi:hypothetical protein